MADAEAEQKAKEAELEAARIANQKKHDAALAAQAESFRLANLAAVAAHAAAEEARKAREAEQIAEHKRQMAERRAKFEKAFRNVWNTGPTGVSMVEMTSHGDPADLLYTLFKGTMVADTINVVNQVKRKYANGGKLTEDNERHKLSFLTSDDRVAEVIEAATAWAGSSEKIPVDVVVAPLATGSKDYINWVKQQTLKRDEGTAFFNQQAEAAMSHLSTTVQDVSDLAHIQTKAQISRTHQSDDAEDDDDDE